MILALQSKRSKTCDLPCVSSKSSVVRSSCAALHSARRPEPRCRGSAAQMSSSGTNGERSSSKAEVPVVGRTMAPAEPKNPCRCRPKDARHNYYTQTALPQNLTILFVTPSCGARAHFPLIPRATLADSLCPGLAWIRPSAWNSARPEMWVMFRGQWRTPKRKGRQRNR